MQAIYINWICFPHLLKYLWGFADRKSCCMPVCIMKTFMFAFEKWRVFIIYSIFLKLSGGLCAFSAAVIRNFTFWILSSGSKSHQYFDKSELDVWLKNYRDWPEDKIPSVHCWVQTNTFANCACIFPHSTYIMIMNYGSTFSPSDLLKS